MVTISSTADDLFLGSECSLFDLPDKAHRTIFAYLPIQTRDKFRLAAHKCNELVDAMWEVASPREEVRLEFHEVYGIDITEKDKEAGLVYDISLDFAGQSVRVRVDGRKKVWRAAYPAKIEDGLTRIVDCYDDHITHVSFKGRLEQHDYKPKDYVMPSVMCMLSRLPRLTHVEMDRARFLPHYACPRIHLPITVCVGVIDSQRTTHSCASNLKWVSRHFNTRHVRLEFRLCTAKIYDPVWVLLDTLENMVPWFHVDVLVLWVELLSQVGCSDRFAPFCKHLDLNVQCTNMDTFVSGAVYPRNDDDMDFIEECMEDVFLIPNLRVFRLARFDLTNEVDLDYWEMILLRVPGRVELYKKDPFEEQQLRGRNINWDLSLKKGRGFVFDENAEEAAEWEREERKRARLRHILCRRINAAYFNHKLDYF